jgi:hypothetical protein
MLITFELDLDVCLFVFVDIRPFLLPERELLADFPSSMTISASFHNPNVLSHEIKGIVPQGFFSSFFFFINYLIFPSSPVGCQDV